MNYDFSHRDSLPKVSCQCITYGRTHLLDEAVECFARQDYPGEKELVILNDYPELELSIDPCAFPDVCIVNLPRRMRTIGEKRNACVALCTGEIIFPWDDDDISLPWRISQSVARMLNHNYYKANKAWNWKNGAIDAVPKRHVFHAMGAWSVGLFDTVDGYPHIESGQDQAIEQRFRKAASEMRVVEDTSLAETYYVYRFPGTGSYHLSACGWGKGMTIVEKYVKQKKIDGRYQIQPSWQQDYVALVDTILETVDA